MKYLPPDTLAYFNAAPQFNRYQFSELPVSAFSAATKDYRKTCGMVSPDESAFLFYALNHCAAIIKKRFSPSEPLPEWAKLIMGEYLNATSQQGLRMLHYVLSICTREMRHLNGHHGSSDKWSIIEQESDTEMMEFMSKIQGFDENAAVKAYMEEPPATTAGNFIKGLSAGFHKVSWAGGSYGGPNWGNVADAAKELILGNTTMEMFVDTGYTLAHNGGPIFNKTEVKMYTHQQSGFELILDVQRSGQIPDLILENTLSSPFVIKPVAAVTAVEVVQAHTNAFKAWVDWVAVKEAAPKDNHGNPPAGYNDYIANQKKAHPQVAPKPVHKTMHGKKVKVTGTWDVYPGQTVEIYERVSAA